MDSELQDALDRFIVGRRAPGMPKEVNDDLEIIFEAARKYADPIGTGLFCEIHWARMSSDVRCQAYQGQLACRPFHGALLALDVEEAPDGQ